MLEIKPISATVVLAVYEHRLTDESFVHCNLEAARCCCRVHVAGEPVAADFFDHDKISVRLGGEVVDKPKNFSGNSCIDCGGMMVRTGTCETCTSCGSTGGCG